MRLRALTRDEVEAIKRLAHSRTAPARVVERARIVWLARAGIGAGEIADQLKIHASTVRVWVARFNAHGCEGLADQPRSGRPAEYTRRQVSRIIDVALSRPPSLGLPFADWTLDRLEDYVNGQCGIAMKRSRIGEILLGEGINWHRRDGADGDGEPARAEEPPLRARAVGAVHPVGVAHRSASAAVTRREGRDTAV